MESNGEFFKTKRKVEQSSKNLDEMKWICFANKKKHIVLF